MGGFWDRGPEERKREFFKFFFPEQRERMDEKMKRTNAIVLGFV